MQLKVNKIRNRTETKVPLWGTVVHVEYRLRLHLELSPEEQTSLEMWGPKPLELVHWKMADWQPWYSSTPLPYGISLRDVLRGWEKGIDEPEVGEKIIKQVELNTRLFERFLATRARYDGEQVIDI